MTLKKTILLAGAALLGILLHPHHAIAQAKTTELFGTAKGQVAPAEVSVGYLYDRANAAAGQCGCFGLNGGYASFVVNMPVGLSLVADLSAVHSGNINGTRQSITLSRYLFGVRYSWRTAAKSNAFFAQALGGFAQENSNFAFVQQTSAPALSFGGGYSRVIFTHLAWTAVEADWVHSQLANGANNRENNLRLSSGLTFRFGPR